MVVGGSILCLEVKELGQYGEALHREEEEKEKEKESILDHKSCALHR